MNYRTHAQWTDKCLGTCLQGYVTTSYARLHELLGEPIPKDDPDKVSTEWIIEFEDRMIATVYEYKETNTYDPGGPSVEVFRVLPSFEWHIGGKSKEVVERVRQLVAKQPDPIGCDYCGQDICANGHDYSTDIMISTTTYDHEAGEITSTMDPTRQDIEEDYIVICPDCEEEVFAAWDTFVRSIVSRRG